MTDQWIQALTIIAANFTLTLMMFLWIRSEANADRTALTHLIFDLTNNVITESKEFHGRISAIEERNKNNYKDVK